MPRHSEGDIRRERVWNLLQVLLNQVKAELEGSSAFTGVNLKPINWEQGSNRSPQLEVKAQLKDLVQLTKSKLKENQDSLNIDNVREALTNSLGEKFLDIYEDKRQRKQGRGSGNWHFVLTFWSTELQENEKRFNQLWESKKSGEQQIKTSTSIDWRDICHKMLKSQQETANLRRKATEQGFEIHVYVPLGLVERKQQQRRQQDEQRDRENVYELTQEVIVKTYEHEAFLREVIAQKLDGNNQHIAIIGEPGAGKTTLLSTIASFINDKTQDFPIFISLANLQEKTIEEYLLKQWLPDAMRLVNSNVVITLEIERQLIEFFGKKGVWLLLDGVDEMAENSSVQALAKINQELTASLRKGRVVLTCRLNVWDAKVSNPLTGFDTYKTQEFKPEQIDGFIHQWFKCAGNSQKGDKLRRKLKETKYENLRILVTNPLRLSLLCQTFYLDKEEELPETKAALYQRFTRYFYEWKSELSVDLYNSDDLKDELHRALSKLAFAGINSSARFRLRRKLAHNEMGEKLFKLACDVGWLNLVDRSSVNEEEVYAFFHPNFQEYFAALNVNDGHKFLDCVPDNPKQGNYRIFEPQWREVILLWLGLIEKELKQQQQEFINVLVNFKDGCGEWNRENVDKGFYEYQAYFLAAAGIAEFKDCSQANDIVNQIIKWGFGYSPEKQKWVQFIYPITKEARSTLQQTDRTKAIATLVQLLQSQNLDESTRWQAAESLEKIDPGNEFAIAALVQLLQSQNL
ncbi:NACHT domain-containing protein, partial [Nostoc sp. UIC 10607]|uniref:NACHT domain-containing protein n=1 Tax=Nostoc sp. UIC 10607 TaxID=3045935 RepID=UPI00399F3163